MKYLNLNKVYQYTYKLIKYINILKNMEKVKIILKELWFSKRNISELLEKNTITEKYIHKNIEYVQKRNRISKMTNKGFLSYLTYAIKNNYVGNNENLNKVIEKINIKKEKKKETIKNKKDIFNIWFNSLSEEKRKDLIQKYSVWNIFKDKLIIIKLKISIDYNNNNTLI